MGCSHYVGRVGALAVFLGVGVSVATTGTAFAAPPPSSTSSSTTAPPTGNHQSRKSATKHDTKGAPIIAGRKAKTTAVQHFSISNGTKTTVEAASTVGTRPTPTVPSVVNHAPMRSTATAAVSTTAATPAATTSTVRTPASSTASGQTILGAVVTVAKRILQTILQPLVSTLPSNVPTQGPVLWTVLAWVRKEVEQNLFPAQAVSVPWPVTSANLLVNPSAEFGDPSLSGTSSVTIPGWTVTGTPTVIEYGTPRRVASPLSTPGPTYAGFPGRDDRPSPTDVQFFGGGNVGTSTLSQTVDLSGAASNIDAGTLPFKLSGWLGGAMTDPSAASVTVRFLGADGTELGIGKIGPVTPLDRWFQTGLLARATSGIIPVGTRSAQVVLTLKDSNPASLGYNNAFADDLSFTVEAALPAPPVPVPPVSTIGSLDHVFMVYMENKGYGDILGSRTRRTSTA